VLAYQFGAGSPRARQTPKLAPSHATLSSRQEDPKFTASLDAVLADVGIAVSRIPPRVPTAKRQQTSASPSGSATATTRLPELLLVEILRLHLATAPAVQRGWVAALHDPVLSPAIALMHNFPERRWTVPELARATAVSRSVLDARFRQMLGRSPIRYLTEWRMRGAPRGLRRRGGVQSSVQARPRVTAGTLARRALAAEASRGRRRTAARAGKLTLLCPAPAANDGCKSLRRA
jgi:AraC-like DNA-binding protein